MQPRTPPSYDLAVPTGDYRGRHQCPSTWISALSTAEPLSMASPRPTPQTSKRRARMTSGTPLLG